MKDLILHAGLPKTGSSALQVFLACNQEALRGQSIDYFRLGEFERGRAGLISSGNGYFVARSLLRDGHPDAADTPHDHLAAVRATITASDCRTGLLSSEFFAECDAARLGNFIDDLRSDGVTTKLVYFVRAQDQLISSAYIQTVKRGHLRETPERYASCVYPEQSFLKYASFYKIHHDIFGPGNVIVRSYEQAIKAESGLCSTFLEAIGATGTGLAFDSKDVNLALSPGQLAIMRELNKFRPNARLADHLVENTGMTGLVTSGETHNILTNGMLNEIKAYFAAENAELAATCFGGDNPFPDSPAGDAPIVDLDEISSHEIIDVLGGLLVRYDERLADLEHQIDRYDKRLAQLDRVTTSYWTRLVRRLAHVARPITLRA